MMVSNRIFRKPRKLSAYYGISQANWSSGYGAALCAYTQLIILCYMGNVVKIAVIHKTRISKNRTNTDVHRFLSSKTEWKAFDSALECSVVFIAADVSENAAIHLESHSKRCKAYNRTICRIEYGNGHRREQLLLDLGIFPHY